VLFQREARHDDILIVRSPKSGGGPRRPPGAGCSFLEQFSKVELLHLSFLNFFSTSDIKLDLVTYNQGELLSNGRRSSEYCSGIHRRRG
jgi:hypothetical protein